MHLIKSSRRMSRREMDEQSRGDVAGCGRRLLYRSRVYEMCSCACLAVRKVTESRGLRDCQSLSIGVYVEELSGVIVSIVHVFGFWGDNAVSLGKWSCQQRGYLFLSLGDKEIYLTVLLSIFCHSNFFFFFPTSHTFNSLRLPDERESMCEDYSVIKWLRIS